MKHKEAVSTVEFYNLADGSIEINLIEDIPSSFDPEIADHLRNLQYAVLHAYMNKHMELDAIGRVFRDGMEYSQVVNSDPAKDYRDDTVPISDDDLMTPVHYLENYLKRQREND